MIPTTKIAIPTLGWKHTQDTPTAKINIGKQIRQAAMKIMNVIVFFRNPPTKGM